MTAIKRPKFCEPCPIKDKCPCHSDYQRCNWIYTFKEVGEWGK